jgi:hypothetical protein
MIAGSARASDTAYLFTYFIKNGQDGLHLACSEDGYKWDLLGSGRSFLTPKIGTKEKLMRDPCVARGPDGTYHMVWTSGWWERSIGHASTKDFITWSEQQEIPVMAHEPTARNSWAPEIFWDDAKKEFIILWATTIPDRFPETQNSAEKQLNHRIYCTTTRDFVSFSPTELFYDPGFNCIDATFLQAAGKLCLIIKDETKFPKPAKNLRIASAGGTRGPFDRLSTPFTPEGLWVEGPSAIKIGEDYLVYFDAYATGHYRVMRSRDLISWEDMTEKASFPNERSPQRMRHGTAIAVPCELIEKLRSVPTPYTP